MTTDADLPHLVSPAWLEEHLHDPDVRVLDCTVFLRPLPGGDMEAESGRGAFEEGHVPGAGFADLIDELSDPESGLRFTLPSPERFAAAMGRLGVGPESRVVAYSAGYSLWGARLVWMLRAFGFDRAAILDGGLERWQAEGRPLESGPPGEVAPLTFEARPRQGVFVDREAVVQALEKGEAVLVNALAPEQHAGTGGPHYGRPGRIPGSVNVPARGLVDSERRAWHPAPVHEEMFRAAGALSGRPVIAYCGGGIAASAVALALARLGVEQVSVYDASLQEWARDPALPMERDG